VKLVGLQRIDGGLTVALPSGRQILVALPDDRTHAARLVGERLLSLLDDPAEPHAAMSPAPAAPVRADDPDVADDDALGAIAASVEAGRLVLRSLQLVTRRRR